MSLPFYLKVSPPFPLSRYTYYALEFLEGVSTRDSKKTMGQFLEVCPKRLCISTVGKRTDLFARDPYKVPITDFFGAVRNVELTREVTNVTSEVKRGDEGHCQKEGCGEKEEEKKKKAMFGYGSPLPILEQFS